MTFQIRYSDENYQMLNRPKWQWARNKSGKPAIFTDKEKARQYIRNHLKFLYQKIEIKENP